MSGLPKNVLYTNNINSSYARNYQNNIAPQNGLGPYGAGETIIINVPTGRNLVMSGADSLLKLSLIVNTETSNPATTAEFVRLDKAGIHSLISRVRVFHGSTLLSDIQNYNNLVGELMALQQSNDSFINKHTILSGTESFSIVDSTTSTNEGLIVGERLNEFTQVADGGSTTKRYYTVPIMNFLSYSDKYIPLFAMTGAPLRLEIVLVNNPLEGICCNKAITSIAINDVEYVCNFMELSDDAMNKINLASNGPLRWVVQDYRNYSHTGNIAANVELSVPVPAKYNSLRSLFFSMRDKHAGEVTYFPLSSNHFGLESYSVRLGSKTVPTKAPSCLPEFFGELIRAIGSVSDLNHEPSININTYDMQASDASTETAADYDGCSASSNFYLGLDLESYSSSGMETVYQGYNSSTDDIFFMPRFSSGAPTVTARIDTYAYFDQVILIENGFATLQY